MKDLFSTQAELYSKYRPSYPRELYEFILEFVKQRRTAFDCATGNGQVARSLSGYFENVFATDISERQIQHAAKVNNVQYSVSAAEASPFPDNSFDLITVAQAYHWLDGIKFCGEARRIVRSGGIVAVWGYDLAYSASPVDALVRHWNFEILAPYWEPERKHVYAHYDDLPFDFESVPVPDFQIVVEWSLGELIGHLKTWSALQTMIRKVGDGAFRETIDAVTKTWGSDGRKRFVFPLFLKLGRVEK